MKKRVQLINGKIPVVASNSNEIKKNEIDINNLSKESITLYDSKCIDFDKIDAPLEIWFNDGGSMGWKDCATITGMMDFNIEDFGYGKCVFVNRTSSLDISKWNLITYKGVRYGYPNNIYILYDTLNDYISISISEEKSNLPFKKGFFKGEVVTSGFYFLEYGPYSYTSNKEDLIAKLEVLKTIGEVKYRFFEE